MNKTPEPEPTPARRWNLPDLPDPRAVVARTGARPWIVGAIAAMVLTAGLAVANEADLPGVSRGGELAYVRDLPESTLDSLDGDAVTATYVGFALESHDAGRDRVGHFEARGRIADATVFHHVDLPDGGLTDLSFGAVQHVERGALLAAGPSTCTAILNGVNAGLGVHALGPAEVRFLATDGMDVSAVEEGVAIENDGHTYLLQPSGNASLAVHGANVVATLGEGGEVRGFIDGEYPATTRVMHAAFDEWLPTCDATPEPEHAGNETENQTASAAVEPAPEPVPVPTPVPDAAVSASWLQLGDGLAVMGVVAENLGTGAANVSLTGTLPDLAWRVSGSDGCTLDAGALACELGEVLPGTASVLELTAGLGDACGEHAAGLSVSAEGDGNATNDAFELAMPLRECPPDVALATASTVDGRLLHLDYVVSNVGVTDAGATTLEGKLPALGDWFLSGADADACSVAETSLDCAWDALAVGEVRTVTAVADVRGLCGTLDATGVTGTEGEESTGDNRARQVIDLGTCIDAAVAQTVSQSGDRATVQLTVTNLGPALSNVSLTDSLPSLDGWVLGGADADACSLTGDRLVCDFGDLEEGGVRTVSVMGYTDGLACGSSVENVASVDADGDQVPGNDAASALIRAAC